ncbi:MAG: hypothetical protein CMJ58_20055 [Planctomycetaceae bacterium]|nr:hypothetical protein [Planctomycetaceae bacterium]
MSRGFRRLVSRLVFTAAVSGGCLPLAAQQFAAAQIPTPGSSAARPAGDFAPGVLTVIEPEVAREDAIQLHDMVEIRANEDLQWEPYSTTVSRTLYEMAKDAPFVQDAWCLQLAMKPLRMIEVDVPQANGQTRRQLVWYLVYRVRNTGAGLSGEVNDAGEYVTAEKGTEPIRFVPEFVLVSQDRDGAGQPIRKAYLDRVVPAAIPAIARREMRGGELLSSVEMAQQQLAIEAGRSQQGEWGVATWVDVDPEIDFFSVYVAGLSNGYRWEDPAGAYEAGDPPGKGRTFTRKTLQLNFWRPGDEYQENEREIRLGVPPGKADLYGVGEGVAYRWIYR